MSAKADRLRDLIIHCNSKAERTAGVEMRALWLNLRDSYRLALRAEDGLAADRFRRRLPSDIAQAAKRTSGLQG
jgi:hypothetical protein